MWNILLFNHWFEIFIEQEQDTELNYIPDSDWLTKKLLAQKQKHYNSKENQIDPSITSPPRIKQKEVLSQSSQASLVDPKYPNETLEYSEDL